MSDLIAKLIDRGLKPFGEESITATGYNTAKWADGIVTKVEAEGRDSVLPAIRRQAFVNVIQRTIEGVPDQEKQKLTTVMNELDNLAGNEPVSPQKKEELRKKAQSDLGLNVNPDPKYLSAAEQIKSLSGKLLGIDLAA